VRAIETISNSPDADLLGEFNATGSEAAFRALVERHLGLVLGTAARRTGDRALAEEIAQTVFAILARKSHELVHHAALAGWLHRATAFECADALRRRRAHSDKVKHLTEHLSHDADGESVWRETLPLLDEAIDALPDSDRELVLLRFFERRSFREISKTIGKSEAASQKQAERALQKLGQSLRRRGVAISTTLLVSGLAAKVAEAAPASLAATVSQGALAGAAGVAAKTTLLNTIAAMSYTKTKTALVVAAIAAIPLASKWRDNNRLENEVQELRHELNAALELADTPRSKRPVSFRTRFDRGPETRAVATPKAADPLPGPVPPTSHEYARMWEMALFSSDPVQRSIELSALLKDLTPENAPAVAAAFERAKSKGLRFNEERRLFLRAWGALDGRAAVANAVGTDDVKATGEVLAALAGWAARDPYTARTWVDSLEDNKDQERIALGLIDGWSTTDFHGAAIYAQSRPRSSSRNKFRELLLNRALLSGGVSGAQNWFYSIPDDQHNEVYKRMAFDEVIEAMLYRDPASAARWIDQLDGKPWLAGSAIGKTAAKLAESAPKESLDWLMSLDGLTDKQAASSLGSTVGLWAQQDGRAAGNWLSANRNHPHYDSMAERYTAGIVKEAPETALKWARSIRDDARRARNEMSVARRIWRDQGAEAEATLAANGFSAEQIAKAQAGAQSDHEWHLSAMMGSMPTADSQNIMLYRTAGTGGDFRVVARAASDSYGFVEFTGVQAVQADDSLDIDLSAGEGGGEAGGGGQGMIISTDGF